MAVKTGLFGGSFDPVHLAHLSLAHCALEQLALDRLLWLPAGRPWQKLQPGGGRGLASPVHRRAMVELMIEGEPRFAVDDSELERDGASYTIDTVRARLAADPAEQLFLVIGQDQYERLHTWRDWRELLARVTLAVAARAGQAIRGSVFGYGDLPVQSIIEDIVVSGYDGFVSLEYEGNEPTQYGCEIGLKNAKAMFAAASR